ncbi:YceD family protein [Thiomicrospira microaerophila]|uniref:YceD family protein n=1 Tax=Thiomicrospira microaerophila TaxID=406020 RepID=UPI0005C90B05|nr:YceD family protein [Thiomicrospira microaerophila]
MFEKIPELIDPVHCAEHNRRFRGRVKQSDLKRLRKQLVSAEEWVEVDLVFRRHPKLKTPLFELSVKTPLCLECQRTLAPFVYPVDSTVTGVYLSSLALSDDLDDGVEFYELPEGNISTYELVEDELLLAIPMIPRKDEEFLTWQAGELAPSSVEDAVEKPNPFAKLQQLRT